jgi:hypothetical protein
MTERGGVPIPGASFVHSKPLSILKWLHRKNVRHGVVVENDTNKLLAGIDGS